MSILADLVLVLHLAFILFVVLGGLLSFKWKWIIPVHLLAAIWGVLVEVGRWGCPLTSVENHFRELAGAQGYQDGFIEHYLVPIIYPEGLTAPIQYMLAAWVILVNAIVYGVYIRRNRKMANSS